MAGVLRCGGIRIVKAGFLSHEASLRANALSLAYGHARFLQRNTGTTLAGDAQHYVLNPEGVLANNRHFIGYTRQEYQPNGDATTEGQALLITGYAHMYQATKDPVWLQGAVHYWEAYVNHFYDGQAIPVPAAPWYCNWIVNGKEPVVAHYPLHPDYPTQGGFKSVPLMFTQGRTQIPHGAPFWGEWLDVASFAHRGHLAWPAINANVQKIAEDVDWAAIYSNWRRLSTDTPWEPKAWIDWQGYLGDEYTPVWGSAGRGVEYALDWIITWSGEKVDWDGNVISTGHQPSEFGTVQLQDAGLNGCYLLNFAVKLPVANGGTLIPRNKPWHNRPINVPVPTRAMSNAADAEQWFGEASHLLWEITGEARYRQAFECVMETCRLYADIDRFDQFFRRSTAASTPWTDGISYDYAYPSSAVPEFGRDASGLITIRQAQAAQQTLEQQAIWMRVNTASQLHIELGGCGDSGTPLRVRCKLQLSPVKAEDHPSAVEYVAPIPDTTDMSVKTYTIQLGQFIREASSEGMPYIVADPRMIAPYGGATLETRYVLDVLGDRAGTTCRLEMNEDGGASVGFWLLPNERAEVRRITYRSGADAFNIRIEDSAGWRWWWMVPATNGEWRTIDLPVSDLRFSGYQPNQDGRPRPAGPDYTGSSEFTLLLDDTPVGATGWLEWYCINDVPPRFDSDSAYTMMFSVTFSGDEAFNALLGDCRIEKYRDDNLAYTPGVIPFSNNLDPFSQQFDGWHGMPYPGYQYPWIWAITDDDAPLNNMVEFLYDSQQAYKRRFGVLGPGAAAYYWNRWDSLSYGPADTFAFTHWGNGEPWSGYQPRAFLGAALAWYTLKQRNRVVPIHLRDYVNNWLRWLAQFQTDHGGLNPTEFPSDALPRVPADDFTGHMTGLWLAGACYAALAGADAAPAHTVINNSMKELQDNYKVVSAGHVMNGCWSPAVRASSDNGMFFGFWAGEILRAIGLYLTYLPRMSA